MLTLILVLSVLTNAGLVVSFFLLKKHLRNVDKRVSQVSNAARRSHERTQKRLAELAVRYDSNCQNIDNLVETLRSVLNAQDRTKFDETFDRIPNKIAEYE